MAAALSSGFFNIFTFPVRTCVLTASCFQAVRVTVIWLLRRFAKIALAIASNQLSTMETKFMNLGNIIWVLWSIAVATPGFIALYFQWKDREEHKHDKEERIKAGNPYAEFVMVKRDHPSGWLHCVLTISNKWTEPITLKKLTAPKGIELTKAIVQAPPHGGYEPDLNGCGSSLEYEFLIPASTAEGTFVQSSPVVFFMKTSPMGGIPDREAISSILECSPLKMEVISHSLRSRRLPIKKIVAI